MSKMSNSNPTELPTKYAAAFRQAIQCYEERSFKRGIKAIESVLEHYPEHGESLAVKGILLNGLKRKEEAYALVKQGVRNNLKSHISWHIYGLLYREDKKYSEAIKCYNSALRFDADNRNILRDLALLQLQVRDIAGFLETRRLLLSKDGGRMNWYSFVFANHLNGNNQKAIDIIDGYNKSMQDIGEFHKEPSYEESQMLLYKAELLEELGKIDDAITLLNDNESRIFHKTECENRLGVLYLKNRDYDHALACYSHLLLDNPNNYVYHNGFQMSLLKTNSFLDLKKNELACLNKSKMTDEQRNTLYPSYDNLYKMNEKNIQNLRFCMILSPISEFKQYLEKYLQWGIKRATPALFTELRPIIKLNEEKGKIILEEIKSYYEIVTSTKKLPNDNDNELEQDSVLATYILQANCLDYQHQYDEAISILDKGLLIDGKYTDIGMYKARILKHQNKLEEAAELMNVFREFELSDRFLNNKTVKYYLRCNNIEKATELIGLFTKKDVDINVDLYTMQVIWFEYECGNAYFRLNNIPMALKKYHSIIDHFNTFIDDQFDFFAYCVRKTNISTFKQMCKLLDETYNNPYYIKAVIGCCKCYLSLNENPVKKEVEKRPEEMTKEELKAYKEKQKREERKREKERKREEERKKKNKKEEDGIEYPSDKDPKGLILASVDKPLDEAKKLLDSLENLNSNLERDLMEFDVNMKRKKYLLCLKYLKNATKIDKKSNDVVERIKMWNDVVKSEGFEEGLKGKVINDFNEYLKKL